VTDTYEPESWHVDLIEDALRFMTPWCDNLDAREVLIKEGPLREANWVRLRGAIEAGCQPCVHASIFGWWGNPLIKEVGATTHCQVCHRSWRSIKEAHCTVCHEHFASNEASAQHWTRDDRHRHPSEIKRQGPKANGEPKFCQSDTEFGKVWILCRLKET